MKKTMVPILAVLVAGAVLSACDQTASSPQGLDSLGGDSGVPPPDRSLVVAQATHGRSIYDKHCAECHGAAGKGQSGDWRIRDTEGMFPPPPLDDSAHAWHHPTTVLLEVVREGSPQGQGKMPAWKNKLSEQDMQDVVVYIKSLWSDQVYRLWWTMEQQSLAP